MLRLQMKKFIFVLLMLFSTSAFSMNADSIRSKTICKAGYLFLIVWSSEGSGAPTVVQIFTKYSENSVARPQPKRCKK